MSYCKVCLEKAKYQEEYNSKNLYCSQFCLSSFYNINGGILDDFEDMNEDLFTYIFTISEWKPFELYYGVIEPATIEKSKWALSIIFNLRNEHFKKYSRTEYFIHLMKLILIHKQYELFNILFSLWDFEIEKTYTFKNLQEDLKTFGYSDNDEIYDENNKEKFIYLKIINSLPDDMETIKKNISKIKSAEYFVKILKQIGLQEFYSYKKPIPEKQKTLEEIIVWDFESRENIESFFKSLFNQRSRVVLRHKNNAVTMNSFELFAPMIGRSYKNPKTLEILYKILDEKKPRKALPDLDYFSFKKAIVANL